LREWYFTDGSISAKTETSKPPTYATHSKLKLNVKL